MAKDLIVLNKALIKTDKPQKVLLNSIIIEPLGVLPKLISSIARWFM
jgi:hypothetical protein